MRDEMNPSGIRSVCAMRNIPRRGKRENTDNPYPLWTRNEQVPFSMKSNPLWLAGHTCGQARFNTIPKPRSASSNRYLFFMAVTCVNIVRHPWQYLEHLQLSSR